MQSSESESIDSCLVEFIDEAIPQLAFDSRLHILAPSVTSSVDWLYEFEDTASNADDNPPA
jgi:hypothetical protein